MKVERIRLPKGCRAVTQLSIVSGMELTLYYCPCRRRPWKTLRGLLNHRKVKH